MQVTEFILGGFAGKFWNEIKVPATFSNAKHKKRKRTIPRKHFIFDLRYYISLVVNPLHREIPKMSAKQIHDDKKKEKGKSGMGGIGGKGERERGGGARCGKWKPRLFFGWHSPAKMIFFFSRLFSTPLKLSTEIHLRRKAFDFPTPASRPYISNCHLSAKNFFNWKFCLFTFPFVQFSPNLL